MFPKENVYLYCNPMTICTVKSTIPYKTLTLRAGNPTYSAPVGLGRNNRNQPVLLNQAQITQLSPILKFLQSNLN